MISINKDGQLITEIAHVETPGTLTTVYGIIEGLTNTLDNDVFFYFGKDYTEVELR